MVSSIILKSQLEGAKRLDAEYYQPEYLDNDKLLRRFNLHKIADIADVVYGTTPKGASFSEHGVPFIRSQNFDNSLIKISELVYCSEDFHNRNRKSEVMPSDILFAAVGATIGEIAIVQDSFGRGNINQNIAKIRVKNDSNPYFVWLFFNSKIGQKQIGRLTTGNAQAYLNTEQIGSFVVPEIEDNGLYKKYYKNISDSSTNADKFYKKAESTFLEELKLNNFQQQDNFLSTVINLSEAKSVHRFDAEYFNSPCNKMLATISKGRTAKLGDLVDMTKGVEPGAGRYQDEGKLFIRVSSISKDGIIDKDQKYLSEDLYNEYKNDYQPRVGEILLTKDASLGVACLVREEVKGIVSSGVMRLKISEIRLGGKENINPEYLTLVLNSIIGRLQAERDAGGSIIAHWKPEQIKNLVVPILSAETQDKIADLLSQSYKARKKARELLEEAKLKVEEMIERNN